LGVGGYDMQIQVIGGGGVEACQILQRQGGTETLNGRSIFLVPTLNTTLQLVCSAEDHGGTVNVYDSGVHVMSSWYCSHLGQPGF
jgi:hypothetical protein